jgi:hypothetical protein
MGFFIVGRDLPKLFPPYGPRSPVLFPISSISRLRLMWAFHRQLRLERESAGFIRYARQVLLAEYGSP